MAVDNEKCYQIGTYSVRVVNTVGAGDVCAAVFWDGLYRKLGIEEVLQRAAAASSIKVQTPGAKKGLPDNEQIGKFFDEKGKKAEEIIDKIENRIYDGIETKKILQMVFRELSKYKPAIKHQIDLRKALSLMQPQPDFERFVQVLLSEHGYEVSPNQIVRGRCGEHEVDAIAAKDGQTYTVEVKHHYKHHTPTGFDVSRIARAVFEDVTEGYDLRMNSLKITQAMIVCNTKLSEHARRYVRCRGIYHIGWSSPPEHDLQTMIEEKKLYPITYLKSLKSATRKSLASAGIILLKQLTQKKFDELRKETRIPRDTLETIIQTAKSLLSENK